MTVHDSPILTLSAVTYTCGKDVPTEAPAATRTISVVNKIRTSSTIAARGRATRSRRCTMTIRRVRLPGVIPAKAGIHLRRGFPGPPLSRG
jgi:hypothetical protein